MPRPAILSPSAPIIFFFLTAIQFLLGLNPPWGESKVKVWIVQTIARVRYSVCLGSSSAVLFGVDARGWTSNLVF